MHWRRTHPAAQRPSQASLESPYCSTRQQMQSYLYFIKMHSHYEKWIAASTRKVNLTSLRSWIVRKLQLSNWNCRKEIMQHIYILFLLEKENQKYFIFYFFAIMKLSQRNGPSLNNNSVEQNLGKIHYEPNEKGSNIAQHSTSLLQLFLKQCITCLVVVIQWYCTPPFLALA